MIAPLDLQPHWQLTPLPGANTKLDSAVKSSNICDLSSLGAELVFIQDAEGRYLSFYWQKAQQYGLSPEQIISGSIDTVFAPADANAYLQKIRQVLETSLPERLSGKFQCGEADVSLSLVISPILKPDGAATTVLVMGNSVSENTEKDLKKETLNGNGWHSVDWNSLPKQKLLSQIARNIRRTLDLDTIWQQTVDSLGTTLNSSRCIIFPYSNAAPEVSVVAEYSQDGLSSMQGKKWQLKDRPYLTKAIATLEPIVVEPTELGENQPAMLVVATYYKKKPNGIICLQQQEGSRNWQLGEIELVRDIAEQVGTAIAHATLYEELAEARRQAEAASTIKSEFLATTTHELRTPLNGMIGFLKLIIDGMADDPEEQQEFIQEAYRSALHLLNIINDILDIAKIEAGKMELELGPVKVNDLLNDVEDFTKAQAQEKKLSFRIQLPAVHDDIIVHGNYQRLLQVMLNLVGNAIKFTHDGGVTVSVEISTKKVNFKDQEFPGMVKVRVADTGIGVSLDKQDRLFQKFTQVDGGLTRQYGGTGLGLTISQKLVEAMGGAVNFYSMGEGLGSTVTFTVPLYREPLRISN